ncbi:predicted protein [Streptomyces viridochromogenes DSM 40736]|uniref:Predicted protein n=1 Tax=Streptomyces viridochromogenes (strain DSM 40736 / JCM 4977 / BCRC 1201 / Tue 494) TaxID=591159 RepID=D9X4H4_STRVT|nr:predicted protein [Streptomyces viridochromogenes DSM 40736]
MIAQDRQFGADPGDFVHVDFVSTSTVTVSAAVPASPRTVPHGSTAALCLVADGEADHAEVGGHGDVVADSAADQRGREVPAFAGGVRVGRGSRLFRTGPGTTRRRG